MWSTFPPRLSSVPSIRSDYFVFELAPRYSHLESGVTTPTRDFITDFVRGTDKLDVSMILSAPLTYLGKGALAGAGQVHYRSAGTNTLVEVSLDADSAPELSFVLRGVVNLAASDFIL